MLPLQGIYILKIFDIQFWYHAFSHIIKAILKNILKGKVTGPEARQKEEYGDNTIL